MILLIKLYNLGQAYPANPNYRSFYKKKKKKTVCFKSIKTIKVKERLRGYFKLKETKKTSSVLSHFAIKDIIETIGKLEWV